MESKAKEKKECTVPEPLWNAWKKARRQGDPQAIADKYGYSRPVVDNAINFGHVKSAGVAENITAYFKERLRQEAKAAVELDQLVDNSKK